MSIYTIYGSYAIDSDDFFPSALSKWCASKTSRISSTSLSNSTFSVSARSRKPGDFSNLGHVLTCVFFNPSCSVENQFNKQAATGINSKIWWNICQNKGFQPTDVNSLMVTFIIQEVQIGWWFKIWRLSAEIGRMASHIWKERTCFVQGPSSSVRQSFSPCGLSHFS